LTNYYNSINDNYCTDPSLEGTSYGSPVLQLTRIGIIRLVILTNSELKRALPGIHKIR